jgi:uncharacterized RDD family membrane protein YckC
MTGPRDPGPAANQPTRVYAEIIREPESPPAAPANKPVEFDHGYGGRFALVVRRTLALLVDTAGVTFLFAIFAMRAISDGRQPFIVTLRGFEMMLATAFVASLVLLFVLEAITGTSIGKLLFGLHVRTLSGKRAGPGRILVRNIFRILDVFAIGAFLALVLRHRQTVGDLASGTTVGRSPLGPFANIAGVVVVAGLIWAEVNYGGGLTSAQALVAQLGSFAPALAQRLNVNLPGASAIPTPQPQPSATASSSATVSPEVR